MTSHSRFSRSLATTAAILAACGGNSRGGGDAAPDPLDARGEDASSGEDAGTDATPGGDGGSQAVACNPSTQQGCAPGDKCSWVVSQVSPAFLGATECVGIGDVPLGEACVDICVPRGEGQVGFPCSEENFPDPTASPPVIGTDDCAAGGICVSGTCKAICESGTCAAESACVGYGDLFMDLDDVGACSATCDPLAQDCGEGVGCYIDPFPGHGYATCESELHADRTQGTPCPTGDCPLNGCAAGYGPWLQDGDGNVLCTAISGAVDTYLDDADGDGTGALVGDPLGTPGVDCGETRIGVAGHQSYFLQAFYANTADTPPQWGICAPSGIENGDCSEFSVAFLFATYDAAESDPDPPSGDEALADLCATTERCGFACVSNAKFDELVTAYCDANDASPACITPASSNARRRIRDLALGATAVAPRADR